MSTNAGRRPDPPELPRRLEDFRGYHAGESILVCGCGTSLSTVVRPERFVTIGVNDVGRLFQPDYLVVLNSRCQFEGDRFRFVAESRARAVFTQLRLGIPHPRVVVVRLGRRGGTELDGASLPYTRNSPYVAVALAMHMGARRIGLIGVDFTDDHFFARTGRHSLNRELPQIDAEYGRLRDACRRGGIDLYNLSATSRLTSLEKIPFEEFEADDPPRARLAIAPRPASAPPAVVPRQPSAAVVPGQDAGVVIPYGGGETQLGNLRAVLDHVRRAGGAHDLVVVEMDTVPHADRIVERAGGRHVFARSDGGFWRARAMNVGLPFVRHERILWLDADLLPGPTFLQAALAELDARRLDCLLPWASLRTLGREDSEAVRRGRRTVEDCAPLRTEWSGAGARDGAVVVRTEFLRRHGGRCEEFHGREAESSAWFAKASVLGRAAVTARRDQYLFRLHPAGDGPAPDPAADPQAAVDARLLYEVRRSTSAQRFSHRFPAPSHHSAPWPGVRRFRCDASAEAIAEVLRDLYGPAVEICGPDVEDAHPIAGASGVPPREAALQLAARLAREAPPPPAASRPGADGLVLDLAETDCDLARRWPWHDGSVRSLALPEVVGLWPDKLFTMNELWRVLQPGGTAEISVLTTDGPGAFADPRLVSFWNRLSFDYFEDGNLRRDAIVARTGIRARFRIVAERVEQTSSGPRLVVTLLAVKTASVD
jgi:hypothetical protein